MIKYTVARIKDYTMETLPSNIDDVMFDNPRIFQYVDNVNKERIYADYLKYFNLDASTSVIIIAHTEGQSNARHSTDALLYKVLGKEFSHKKIKDTLPMFAHTAYYILNMPEDVCDRIIPEQFKVVKNSHIVEVWMSSH